jgi:hypothetical protein
MIKQTLENNFYTKKIRKKSTGIQKEEKMGDAGG